MARCRQFVSARTTSRTGGAYAWVSVALARVRACLWPAKCASTTRTTPRVTWRGSGAHTGEKWNDTRERVRIMGNGGVVRFMESVKRFSLGPFFDRSFIERWIYSNTYSLEERFLGIDLSRVKNKIVIISLTLVRTRVDSFRRTPPYVYP